MKQQTSLVIGNKTYHLAEREDGSVVCYFTYPTSSTHFVIWDTLDTHLCDVKPVRYDTAEREA